MTFPQSLHLFTLSYADDTKCCVKIRSSSDSILLQQDLDLVRTCTSDIGLSFNTGKSCLLRFPNRSTNLINYNTLTTLGILLFSLMFNAETLIGVLLCDDLSWTSHYNSISAKAYRQLGLIRRTLSSSVSVRAKKLLYLTLVRSQLT